MRIKQFYPFLIMILFFGCAVALLPMAALHIQIKRENEKNPTTPTAFFQTFSIFSDIVSNLKCVISYLIYFLHAVAIATDKYDLILVLDIFNIQAILFFDKIRSLIV